MAKSLYFGGFSRHSQGFFHIPGGCGNVNFLGGGAPFCRNLMGKLELWAECPAPNEFLGETGSPFDAGP